MRCREANNHIVLIECVCVCSVYVCVCVCVYVCVVCVCVCWCVAKKLWKECWQHWCKKMSGIKILLTLLISTLTSNISFIQLSSFNCLQCFRDIRRLVLMLCRLEVLGESFSRKCSDPCWFRAGGSWGPHLSGGPWREPSASLIPEEPRRNNTWSTDQDDLGIGVFSALSV